MIPDDPAAAMVAHRLAARMTEISEYYYHAGWQTNLEYSLWAALEGSTRGFCPEVKPEEVEELRDLSRRCNGWWCWDNKDGETFVELPKWKLLYSKHQLEMEQSLSLEHLLQVAIDRLHRHQAIKFKRNRECAIALTHLETALMWLQRPKSPEQPG